MCEMSLSSENALKKLLQKEHRDGALWCCSFAFTCSEGFSTLSTQTRLLAEPVQHSSSSLFPSFLAADEVVCVDEHTGSTLQHSHKDDLLVSEKHLKPLEMNVPVERMLNGVCANWMARDETNAAK